MNRSEINASNQTKWKKQIMLVQVFYNKWKTVFNTQFGNNLIVPNEIKKGQRPIHGGTFHREVRSQFHYDRDSHTPAFALRP